MYFPVILSALDIPPWSDQIQKQLGIYWHRLVQADNDDKRLAIIEALDLATPLNLTSQQLLEQVRTRIRRLEAQDDDSLRLDEYTQFTLGHSVGGPGSQEAEFETRYEEVPPELKRFFSYLVRVTRLREVRALRSFTRVRPPADAQDGADVGYARLSLLDRNWLPATEVRGEGIFLAFDESAVTKWEASARIIRERTSEVHSAYVREYRERFGPDAKIPRIITPRLLLVHSFAHVLMRQLSLECGYSTAALRERLYVDDRPQRKMAGLLVYTATPDSDGTLGGLCRQGLPARVVSLVEGAIQSMEWCSSDPLCIEGTLSTAESLNRAACHSCLLAPETSCEEFNRLIDRATLVGLPNDRTIGFFGSLVSK